MKNVNLLFIIPMLAVDTSNQSPHPGSIPIIHTASLTVAGSDMI